MNRGRSREVAASVPQTSSLKCIPVETGKDAASRVPTETLRADPEREPRIQTALLKVEQLALDVETAAITAQ
jgi:hypothetical protein